MNTERTEEFVNAIACDLEEGGFRQVSGTTLRRTLATAVSAAMPLLADVGIPASQPAELADASVVEQIAQQWDGCQYDAPGEMVDIGAAIRRAGKRLSAELTEQQGVSLPPFPRTYCDAFGDGSEPLYTGKQMQDYARAALAAGATAASTGAVLVNMGDSEAEFIRMGDDESAIAATGKQQFTHVKQVKEHFNLPITTEQVGEVQGDALAAMDRVVAHIESLGPSQIHPDYVQDARTARAAVAARQPGAQEQPSFGQVREIRIPARNKLDPISVFVQDQAAGRGRIVVTCYGNAWQGFWNAMGDRTVMQFVAKCDPDYVAGSMLQGRQTRIAKHDRDYATRIAAEVIAEFRTLIDQRDAAPGVGNG